MPIDAGPNRRDQSSAVDAGSGAAAGAFASIALYTLLFKLLMRLDWQDTAVCVTVTFVLVTFSNYAAYKLDGILRDAWI